MSFADRIKALAQRIPSMMDSLQTEEATKNALVMPFIAALGYDVFNPLEVIPEFTSDVGTKKGEKVDYAIRRGDEIIMVIEAKKAGAPLAIEHASQLYRYFGVTKTRIALLTNGVEYRFYADLDEPNKMDSRPFLEIDLLDLRDKLLVELKKLTKSGYNLDGMLSAANDLKYMQEIRRVIEEQIEDPDEEFVRFFFQRANPSGRFVASAREQFTGLVQRAFAEAISDRVGNRLRSALDHEDSASGRKLEPESLEELDTGESAEVDDGIDTTEEELAGFRVIQAIVCNVIEVDRVSHRDAKSYFSVLVDNNNRKPICRLHFNRKQRYIGTFDEERTETRHAIENINDLYKFADTLRTTAMRYGAPPAG